MYSNNQIIKTLESCFQNVNFFPESSISVLIHLKCLQYPIPRYSLSLLAISLKFHTGQLKPLFNANLITCSSSVSSILSPTPFDYKPQLLDIPNLMPSPANQIYYQAIYKSKYLIGQTRYLPKS